MVSDRASQGALPRPMSECHEPERPAAWTARHNRKPDRMEEPQRNLQRPDVQTMLPAVTRCSSKICVMAPRPGSSSPRCSTRFSKFSFLFKGAEATQIVLSILPNKRSTPKLGLDAHLKTLYSLTLVLLFSLSFSQSKAWPAHSM